jgi:hypothetical protein
MRLYIRLAIGLAQGLALFLLFRSIEDKSWLVGQPVLRAALMLTAWLAPLVPLGGLGAIRPLVLIVWSLVAAAVTSGFAAWDILRQADPARADLEPAMIGAAQAVLFIAHHLIAASDQERRLVAPYRAYFDLAWKDGVQLVLSGVFTAVFWGVLLLGVALFNLIGIKWLEELIRKEWFVFPATALVFAWAVHVTDVRIGLIRGIRTVALALLSWLMPLMALLAAAFLLALPFTGLAPLWKTRTSAGILLGAAAALIVLVNAAYQDGDPERRPVALLRYANRLAAALIAPLVAIAAYGLWLRVAQHGWTPERIIASACALIGACYGAGYLAAAVMPGPWLKPLERTNVATAWVVLGVILALFTPLADPARISVADQVARLERGAVKPEAFDFAFLKFKAGRFGVEALKALSHRKTGLNAAVIAQSASEALQESDPFARPKPAKPTARITPYPKGRTLPDDFLNQDWSQENVGDPCFHGQSECDAFFADLDGDGTDEVLLASTYELSAFRRDDKGRWVFLGPIYPYDPKIRAALRAGTFNTSPASWKDIEADGRRLRLTPQEPADSRFTATQVIIGRK